VIDAQFLCFSDTMKPMSYIELSPNLLNSAFDAVLVSTSMDIHTDPAI
jgi:hypothetical protein